MQRVSLVTVTRDLKPQQRYAIHVSDIGRYAFLQAGVYKIIVNTGMNITWKCFHEEGAGQCYGFAKSKS